jgi:magnesium-transporting ATPase (P-type)
VRPAGLLETERVHALPGQEVALLLETEVPRGLSGEEAARRLARFGPNVLPAARRRGPLLRLLLQFHHPLVYLLLAATGVTVALGEWVDAGVIFGVVLVNAVVGFVQESRAERALEALVAMVRTEATVLRDGGKRRVPASEVVPGDLLLLEAGDKVPADLRLLSVRELQVDESALTGESVPVAKEEGALPSETVLADRRNMAFFGTLVTAGHGTGVAVGTGAATEIGRIHRLVGETVEIATPLTRKIARFSKHLTVWILALAGLTFVLGLARGQPAAEIFMAALALAVGAIPEGLPAALTITLAIGVARMARRHAIIRRLPAVETLGSVTVICTDKTGTLTENQMTVQAIVAGGQRFTVGGTGYAPAGEIRLAGEPVRLEAAPALRECLLAGVLCNDSVLVEREGAWEILGDPTEAALLVAARKGGIDPIAVIDRLPRLDAIPFESGRRYMATLHGTIPGAPGVVYVKGAVETVVKACADLLGPDGQPEGLDRAAVLAQAEELAGAGLRLLAFARGRLPAGTAALDSQSVAGGLTFLGLQAMMDPPRPEAIAAVRACRTAGIAVKMITGNHALTAGVVAGHIGLDRGVPGDEGPRVMSGLELAACPEERLPGAIARTAVFARVSPEQKLRIVEALQARDEVVAMTGDGVNDAPALKRADIGVAMGRTGTEVAKEASDMVLTDDNFASIEAAVEEGRGVFDNLTKFIVWTLPTNAGEGLVVLAAIAAGMVLPILPVQILWINMTTAVALGMMLAFEPKEAGIMERPPRDPRRPLLTGELVERLLLVGILMMAGAFGLFLWELERGTPLDEARTVAVNVFVLVELFYLFNCRSLERSVFRVGLLSNPWALWGALGMVALQLLLTYVPLLNHLFHTAPIGLPAWGRIVAFALVVSVVVEAEKALRRALARRRRVSGGRGAAGHALED